MIGRVTTMMIAQSTLDELNASYNRLSNTQEEMSTGKRINQASDDPYGMSRVLELQGQLGGLTAYSGQVSDGTAWATATQSALTNMTNIVQRARELTVEGANGVNSQSDLNATADEVDQLASALEQEANTSYNGQYIFSGTANTQPYTSAGGDAYRGNSGAINRTIGPNTSIQVNVDVSSVLGNGSSGSGGSDGKLIATLRQISSDMRSGNTSALSNTDLNSLDTNFDALTQMQASVGALSDRLQLASTRIQSLQQADTQVLSDTQDADMAQTAIDYSTQQAAYTAALKAGASIVQSSLMDFLTTS